MPDQEYGRIKQNQLFRNYKEKSFMAAINKFEQTIKDRANTPQTSSFGDLSRTNLILNNVQRPYPACIKTKTIDYSNSFMKT